MKEMFRIALSIALCAVMICNAAPLAVDKKNVASLGTTEIANSFGKIHVSVKIETHEVDIGRPSDPWPERRVSSCTHSRFPCSLVDYIEIKVNGTTLFVARSVYADLADLSMASLSQNGRGQFVLTLAGGDASEGYSVEVAFDKDRVKHRTRISGLDRQVTQKTTYYVLPPL